MKNNKIIIFYLIIFLVACEQPKKQTLNSVIPEKEKITEFKTSYKNGKECFSRHCKGCHLAPDKRFNDAQIFDRYFERIPSPAEEYFISFLKDSKALRDSGDRYAIKLHNDFGNQYNHHFKDTLTDTDFENLILYIKAGPKLRGNNVLTD